MKRNGSALLIVLGVLAFLLISAVAFSAFVRRARLPSTYLRRGAASRQLAKAALAEAIDDLDRAIANDVHPNLGTHEGNVWRRRVFFHDATPVDLALTAPVLTLEGLAYIPPPLVNEARYLQRITPTAQWKPFHFDVGRYAYLALDVSDYFDVNRLLADVPRSSAANGRVRIAHLFEDANHRNAPSSATEWDRWMESFRTFDDETLDVTFDQGSKIPLVSLADFNLALGKRGAIGRLRSPFYDYITGSGSGTFYATGSGGGSQSDEEAMQSMTFVTDGWFPQSSTRQQNVNGTIRNQQVYDLNDPLNQPFKMTDLEEGRMTVDGAMASKLQAKRKGDWLTHLSGLGCVMLADYLDADRVPLSLALPTTERVPMICGIAPSLGNGVANFSFLRVTDALKDAGGSAAPADAGGTRTVSQVVRWRIASGAGGFVDAFRLGKVEALVTYPFLHPDGSDDQHQFTIDGRLAFFFSSATDGVGSRTDPEDTLHLNGATIRDVDFNANPGVFAVGLKFGSGSLPIRTLQKKDADEQEDAVAKVTSTLPGNIGSLFAQDGNEFLRVRLQWTQTRPQNPDGSYTAQWTPEIEDVLRNPTAAGYNTVVAEANSALPPLTKEGKADPDFTTDLAAKLFTLNKRIRFNAAVWLRIKDKYNNKIVDMVPACLEDDRLQNGKALPRLNRELQRVAGEPFPVMRFNTGIEFDFNLSSLMQLEKDNNPSMPIAISPRAVLVADPRYNYAPEQWYVMPDGGDANDFTPESWTRHNCLGADGREDDIFMATSDAGYLQSVNELAFLPRLTNLKTYGASDTCGNLQSLQNLRLMEFRTMGNEYNHDFMWRNYDPIDRDEEAFDQDLPFVSEGSGVKVNPYSDCTNVLMAAFVNTPLDWRRASTNVMGDAEDYAGMKAADYNKKYAWNEYSAGGNFAYDDLEQVAIKYMLSVRSQSTYNWRTSWRDLGWFAGSDPDEFLGLTMSADTDRLWSCDRRFFYGYWGDCFDARQQLFLVFVRAEQLMLAGGEADQLPPQKGGRAVALVWRDPTAVNNSQSGAASGGGDGYPHRTRILFYRQLD